VISHGSTDVDLIYKVGSDMNQNMHLGRSLTLLVLNSAILETYPGSFDSQCDQTAISHGSINVDLIYIYIYTYGSGALAPFDSKII
jgi:hypothetical protein